MSAAAICISRVRSACRVAGRVSVGRRIFEKVVAGELGSAATGRELRSRER